MGYTRMKFEELSLIDDFMMNAVAGDPHVGEAFCRKLLSVLLQRNIGKLQVTVQRVVTPKRPDLRGIRMDVEVEEFSDSEDVVGVYDLEPHTHKRENLAKRNRFYQAKIDVKYLHSGEKDFSKLPNLYVVTILDFDPFGQDYMMYTISNQCKETDVDYQDGLTFLYFYTGGSKGGSPEIKAMLDYIHNSCQENVTTEAVKEIHSYVNEVKELSQAEGIYMTWEEYIQDIYDEVREETEKEITEKVREETEKEVTKKVQEETKIKSLLQNIFFLLQEKGTVSEELKSCLEQQKDIETLEQWFRSAVRSGSVKEFEKVVGV